MNDRIKLLIERVEACFGKEVTTSRHFDELRLSIYERTGELLSATTLKRLWGYVKESVIPRIYTLDTLSQYAGWTDWKAFSLAKLSDVESGPVNRFCIDVGKIQPGTVLVLTWAPDRICKIRYFGNETFEIILSQNSRLCVGDRFRCSHIIYNEPLYLNDLTRNGVNLGVYVCGRKSGIRFNLLSD